MKIKKHQILNFPHAIMFHHFHGGAHLPSQGSISADQFSDMIDWLEKRYNLLRAREFQSKLILNSLEPHDICLTFDDALLCQFEIAVPILERRGLEAFFFVYSGPFSGVPEPLEIYRYFRTTQYKSIEEFYSEFFLFVERDYASLWHDATSRFDESEYLAAYQFYSAHDKLFRYLRDEALEVQHYNEIMNSIMEAHLFKPHELFDSLWMNNSHLKQLHCEGHVIGLHSFSHPTRLDMLSVEEQVEEYRKNFDHLTRIVGVCPTSMSHPCGRYNKDTLRILADMGVTTGFRSNASISSIRSNFEVPREDHANVLKAMSI